MEDGGRPRGAWARPQSSERQRPTASWQLDAASIGLCVLRRQVQALRAAAAAHLSECLLVMTHVLISCLRLAVVLSCADAVCCRQPSTSGSVQPMELLKATIAMFKGRIWEIIILYGLKDILAFLLHRFTQRLTNHGA